ncbi:hypothetical protein Tco_0088280 [Tanacetum coccineum]
MSSYTHPSIHSDYDVEDAFSFTNAPNYISTPPDYSPVTPGNISPAYSGDLTKDLLSLLSILPFHDDPYMKMPPKRTSTSAAPAMTQAVIWQLITDGVAVVLLLTNKYCPRTEVKKMEDEFCDLTVKGNNLKTYVRRFQELAALCLNMVPNTKKLKEISSEGYLKALKEMLPPQKPKLWRKPPT